MKHKCPNCGCEFAETVLSEREIPSDHWNQIAHDSAEDEPPMVCKRCGDLTPAIARDSHNNGTLCQECADWMQILPNIDPAP